MNYECDSPVKPYWQAYDAAGRPAARALRRLAKRLMPGLERRLEGRARGRGAVRPLHPRPLCDRRLALPDHAARRGAAAHDRRGRAGDRDRARREGVSVLPRGGGTSQCGQTVNASLVVDCSKHLNQHPRARRRRPALRGRARHRARRPQPRSSSRTACGFRSTSRPPRAPPSAAWPATIPAAPARCATATRARTCSSIDAVLADGTHGAFRPGRAGPVRHSRELAAAAARARPARASARARRTRSQARFPKVQRRVGGYNLDALTAGTQRAQSRAYPGRLRRHARLLDQDRAEAVAAARPAARSAPAISAASTRRWMRPSTSSSSGRSRSSWSTAP